MVEIGLFGKRSAMWVAIAVKYDGLMRQNESGHNQCTVAVLFVHLLKIIDMQTLTLRASWYQDSRLSSALTKPGSNDSWHNPHYLVCEHPKLARRLIWPIRPICLMTDFICRAIKRAEEAWWWRQHSARKHSDWVHDQIREQQKTSSVLHCQIPSNVVL